MQGTYFSNKQPDLRVSMGQNHDQRQFTVTGYDSNAKEESDAGKFLGLLHPHIVKYLLKSTVSNTQLLIFL